MAHDLTTDHGYALIASTAPDVLGVYIELASSILAAVKTVEEAAAAAEELVCSGQV